MYDGKLVFAQVMEFLPRHEFDKAIRRYRGNHRVRGLSCRDQFLAMAFAQLTYRESLRDIETCLRSVQSKLYHLGFRAAISRSTLADANRQRDWRIYADFADQARSCAIHRRALRSRAGEHCLRARFDDDRSLPVAFPPCAISTARGGRQAAHAVGPAGRHPLFCVDFAGKNARC
jgi:hypothetical protein